MNFLQLCQRARSEMGVAGLGPTAVAGQSGMSEKIVNWVNDSYLEIQGKYGGNWRFMWRKSNFPITSGKSEYTPKTDWGVDVRNYSAPEMSLYNTAQGPNSRYWPQAVDWQSLSYMLRTNYNAGIPQFYAESPAEVLTFVPTPDRAMILEAAYYLRPSKMVENTELPRMPEEFHMAIVWRAVMMYGGSDEAIGQVKHAVTQYNVIMAQMADDQLEPITFGPTFA